MAVSNQSASTEKKPDINKAKKFVEIGKKRASKLIKAMRNMSKLGNAHNYTYTVAQVENLKKLFDGEYKAMLDAFNPHAPAKKNEIEVNI